MKLYKRGGMAVIAIVGAALVAVGCGGSGGSGAAAAAKDSAALDLVPRTAIGYATFDVDFTGDNWEQFNDLAKAFDPKFKGIATEVSDEASDDEDEVDFEKDVDPWLGETAGAALLSAPEGDEDEGEFFAWFDIEDSAKFEDFAKEEDLEAGDKIGDYETFDGGEDQETFIAYNDELGIVAESRKQLEEYVEYDGDSITEADGVGDAVDEVGDDALMTLVLSGDGARKAIADTPEFESLKNAKQLKDFHALAVSVSAEDDGMRLSGFVGADGEDAPENQEHELFDSLPSDTLFAIGGHDFGGTLKQVADEAGKDNAQVQQGIGAATAALGVDVDDLAEAFDGEFVLGMSASDEGLGSLAGSVAGAFMGGGLSGADPAAIAKSASIILAFEETGDSGETLDKLTGAVSGLVGATEAPKEGNSGDFETKTLDVSGFPVTTGASDDVAALTFGADVFEEWGEGGLGENETYTAAWDAADAPDKSAGIIWFDAARVAKLAGVKSEGDGELGGLVGWAESDGSNGKFGMFLHVEGA